MATIKPDTVTPTEPEKNPKTKEESSLVGTAIGVGLVGGVILITYIVLYGLYLVRV